MREGLRVRGFSVCLVLDNPCSSGPLESTVCEFWSMVWDQQVPAIVMLTKNFDLIRVMCVQYWPR